MTITASMVRELRERTGAAMMDCKKALEATGGDFEQAVDHLRMQGLKTADKKSSRQMGEGRVFARVEPDSSKGSIVAVACETDFVARTPDFEQLLEDLCQHVMAKKPGSLADGPDSLLQQKWEKTGTSVEEAVKAAIGKLGENISLVDFARMENAKGRVGSYIHHNNKVGVLVSVSTDATGDVVDQTVKDLCLHIAAIKPEVLNREECSADAIEREKAIYREEVKDKPENIQDKIIAGKLEKYFGDRVLGEQPWVKDDKKTVQKALEAALGKGVVIEAFRRIQIGD